MDFESQVKQCRSHLAFACWILLANLRTSSHGGTGIALNSCDLMQPKQKRLPKLVAVLARLSAAVVFLTLGISSDRCATRTITGAIVAALHLDTKNKEAAGSHAKDDCLVIFVEALV